MVMNGPAKSTAVLVKALRDDFSLEIGSGAMTCRNTLAFLRRHSAHSFSHDRIISRPDITQYRADSAANV